MLVDTENGEERVKNLVIHFDPDLPAGFLRNYVVEHVGNEKEIDE